MLALAVNIFGHFVTDLFTMYHVTPFMLIGFYVTFLLTMYFRCNKKSGVDKYDHSGIDDDTDDPTRQSAPGQENQAIDHDSDVGSEDQDEDYDEEQPEESDQAGEPIESEYAGDRKKTK